MGGQTIYLKSGVKEHDIQAAFSAASDGDTIVLPEDHEIVIAYGLNLDVRSRSITLDLNGSTLQQGGNSVVLTVQGGHADGASAKLGKNGSGAVTVTYSDAKSVSIGDWVKVYSDDELPNDQGANTRLGQAMKVTSVSGSTLTLEGPLHYADLYKTNVRASAYESGSAVITNGTIRGDQGHSSWTTNLLDLRSTVGAEVSNLIVRDGNSMGVNFVDSVNGQVKQSAAINLTDDTSRGHYGYGVHSAMSVNTTVQGLYTEEVRHSTDNNSVGLSGTHVNPAKYGADFGMTVSNVVAVANTAYAFSWHTEGRHSVTTDAVVYDSYGVLGARGLDNQLANVSGAGNSRGFVFFEYGDGDGRRINVSNMHLKETSGFAFYNQGNPDDNTISNSWFEVLSNKVTIAPSDPRTTIKDTIIKAGQFAVNESIDGTGSVDRLLGGKGDDVISGKGDKDYIWGGDGQDVLNGGYGVDRFAYLNVGEGGDTIEDFTAGQTGDVIDVSGMWYHYGWRTFDGHVRFAQSGADTLFQVDANGGGNSYVTMARLLGVSSSEVTGANLSNEIVVSGTGTVESGGVRSTATDEFKLPPVFSDLFGLALQLGREGDDNLLGTNDDDLLVGSSGDDRLSGFAGDDVLVGGAGADTLRGGSGYDIASYADAPRGLVASLDKPSSNTGDAAGDSYNQIRGFTGSAFDDKLTGNDSMNTLSGGAGDDLLYGLAGSDTLLGNAGADKLYGGDQNDVIDGGSGDDHLFGDAGYDMLTGGDGADRFYIDGPTGTYDKITDFEHRVDKIVFATNEYKVWSVSDIDFVSGRRPSAETKDATLLYNTESGELWWDSDGTGWHSPVHIADLLNTPDFSLGDIVLM